MTSKRLPDLIVLLIEISFGVYVCYRQTHGYKQSIEKTHVGNLWTVVKSVNNKYTNGFTNW
jgi:hypothetical protein